MKLPREIWGDEGDGFPTLSNRVEVVGGGGRESRNAVPLIPLDMFGAVARA
jgi:hypothetical protein